MTFWEKMKIVFSQIWDFLVPAVRIFLTSAGEILAISAMQAVQVVATYAIDNDELKRKMAYDLIFEDLKRKGIEKSVSSINLAIEMAVKKMKAG